MFGLQNVECAFLLYSIVIEIFFLENIILILKCILRVTEAVYEITWITLKPTKTEYKMR